MKTTTTYFKNPHTLEELRSQYKELLKKYHPDNASGSTEATQEINAEYDRLFKILKDRHENNSADINANNTTYNYNLDKALREILEKVINFEGINIEICGSWLWLSGNTYTHKATLKTLGFRWANNKKMWYWHNEEYVKRTRKTVSMDFIREKYGSKEIQTQRQACLA